MALQPFVKLAYNGALGKQHSKTSVTALDALNDSADFTRQLTSSFANPGSGSVTETTTTYGGNEAWKKARGI